MDAVAEQLLEDLRAQRALMEGITAELEQLRAVTAEAVRDAVDAWARRVLESAADE